jgi:hypothetical protein
MRASRPYHHTFFLSFVIVFINYIFYLLIFNTFLHRDDWQILQYASGTLISDEPAEFLLYTHISIGLLIKYLYTHFPEIPWYGIYLHLLLFASSWFTLFAILHQHHSLLRIILFVCFFHIVQAQHILHLQYTIVSAYCTIAGFLLLFSTVRKPNNYIFVLAFFMFWIGFLIRSSGFLLTFLTCAPPFIFYILYNYKLISIKPLFIFTVVSTVIILLSHYLENDYYIRHAQMERLEMNMKISYIHNYDFLNYDQYKELYAKVGLTKVDFDFGLDLYNCLDRNTFSHAKIDALLANNDSYTWKVIRMRGIKECFLFIFNLLQSDFMVYKIGLFILLILLLNGMDWQNIALLGFTFSIILAGLVGLYLFRNIKYACEMMFPFLVILSIWRTDISIKKYLILLIIIVLYAFYILIAKNIPQSRDNAQKQENCRYFLNQLDSNKLYVAWGNNAHNEGFSALEDITPYKNKHLASINYYTDAPTVMKKLQRRFNIKNLNKDIIDHKNVLFLTNQKEGKAYIAYINQHYGYRPKLIKKDSLFDFSIYKVVSPAPSK